jgi:hypothetical protein
MYTYVNTGLENFRTLCVACHHQATRALMARRKTNGNGSSKGATSVASSSSSLSGGDGGSK